MCRSKCRVSANYMDSHGEGTIVSIEYHILPLYYINIQGRAYDGSIVKSSYIPDSVFFLITYDLS